MLGHLFAVYVGPKCTLAESLWLCRQDIQTDWRTPDRYITLSARCGRRGSTRLVKKGAVAKFGRMMLTTVAFANECT